MFNPLPRITLAALRGGSGKTLLSLGLTAAWRKKGHKVAPFKKGPDFIDAGWLSFAAGRDCHNLDPFMMTDAQMGHSFFTHSVGSDISLIEGNRGLYDGLDLEGRCSTAELGKLLKTPVILIVDVTMSTRTVAASVLGCQKFDPGLEIVAVVLNRVGGPRQESLVRHSIERYCGIPVLGSIPRQKDNLFPERHMGLIPYQEREEARRAIAWAQKIVEDHLDLEIVWKLAHDVEPLERKDWGHYEDLKPISRLDGDPHPRIGFVRDNAFWFYYPENLRHLKDLGAKLVKISAMTDPKLPDLDALYIGGGFPETQAAALAENRSFREDLRAQIESGLPVYAECGGLMYLGKNLIVNGASYPMAGALPIDFALERKPQGHGYTILEVTDRNIYFEEGDVLKGHEFHYSRPRIQEGETIKTIFKVKRGRGLDGAVDGIYVNNLLATYTHLHAGGNPAWGENFFRAALRSKKMRNSKNFIDFTKNN